MSNYSRHFPHSTQHKSKLPRSAFLALSAAYLLAIPNSQSWSQTPSLAPAPSTVSRIALSASNALELTLEQAVQLALGNADVLLAKQQVLSTQADVIAANHAPAPVLSAKISSIDLQNGLGAGNPMTQKRIDKGLGLDWVWERGNKRLLRTEAAQEQTKVAKADLLEVLLQQKLLTSAAFFELAASQERVERIQAMEQSAMDLARTAQRRVQAGDLAAQDAARFDIEYRRAQGDTLSAKLDWQRAILNLQTLVYQINTINSGAACAYSVCEKEQKNIKNSAEIKAIAAWPSLETAPDTSTLLQEQKKRTWLDQRLDIQAARHRLAAAKAQLDLSLSLKKADITWGASYDHFPGTSKQLFELRMQMPIQLDQFGAYNYAGEIKKAQILVAQAQTSLERTEVLAQNEYLRLVQEIDFTQSRLRNYALDILPRAKQVEANAELAYSKGALSLTDLIEARRTLRATQLEALSAKLEYAKAYYAWQIRAQIPSIQP